MLPFFLLCVCQCMAIQIVYPDRGSRFPLWTEKGEECLNVTATGSMVTGDNPHVCISLLKDGLEVMKDCKVSRQPSFDLLNLEKGFYKLYMSVRGKSSETTFSIIETARIIEVDYHWKRKEAWHTVDPVVSGVVDHGTATGGGGTFPIVRVKPAYDLILWVDTPLFVSVTVKVESFTSVSAIRRAVVASLNNPLIGYDNVMVGESEDTKGWGADSFHLLHDLETMAASKLFKKKLKVHVTTIGDISPPRGAVTEEDYQRKLVLEAKQQFFCNDGTLLRSCSLFYEVLLQSRKFDDEYLSLHPPSFIDNEPLKPFGDYDVVFYSRGELANYKTMLKHLDHYLDCVELCNVRGDDLLVEHLNHFGTASSIAISPEGTVAGNGWDSSTVECIESTYVDEMSAICTLRNVVYENQVIGIYTPGQQEREVKLAAFRGSYKTLFDAGMMAFKGIVKDRVYDVTMCSHSVSTPAVLLTVYKISSLFNLVVDLLVPLKAFTDKHNGVKPLLFVSVSLIDDLALHRLDGFNSDEDAPLKVLSHFVAGGKVHTIDALNSWGQPVCFKSLYIGLDKSNSSVGFTSRGSLKVGTIMNGRNADYGPQDLQAIKDIQQAHQALNRLITLIVLGPLTVNSPPLSANCVAESRRQVVVLLDKVYPDVWVNFNDLVDLVILKTELAPKILYVQDYSFSKIAEVVSKGSILFGLSSEAMAYMSFMSPGCVVVQAIHKSNFHLRHHVANMALASGHHALVVTAGRSSSGVVTDPSSFAGSTGTDNMQSIHTAWEQLKIERKIFIPKYKLNTALHNALSLAREKYHDFPLYMEI